MASENSTYISEITQKRLIHDITELYKNPLDEHGIYYKHDDASMLKGYAMIIGPRDSLYQNGIYFFEFNFPHNYPQQPPNVKFMTNDGITRFHPNLYKNGKVCLSILNTWRGEGWTSCQTIKSILLTIISIMDNKPLLHEPGIKENHSDFNNYNEIIKFKNITFSLLEIQDKIPDDFKKFEAIINIHFEKCKDEVIEYIQKMIIKHPDPYVLCVSIYNINVSINWMIPYNLVRFF